MAGRPRFCPPSLLVLLLYFLPVLSIPGAEPPCQRSNTSLVGFEADLAMVQHQVRGVFRVIDRCSFAVSGFDMLQGSNAVRWWGAAGENLENLTQGFEISNQMLNRTYRSENISVRLVNRSWDEIAVVAVWDPATASDFGHVVLRGTDNESEALPPAPSPGPAPSPSKSPSAGEKNRQPFHRQPTMLANCKKLSSQFRLRWTLNSETDSVDLGLEASAGSQYYMAFGWASPESEKASMIHADVTIASFTEEGVPFADDYYITDYTECQMNKDGTVQGVCPDTVYEDSDGSVNNTRLVYGHRRDGVSFIRYNRPLASTDKKYDVTVNKSENMTVLWALGKIRPPDSLHPFYLPQNHGGNLLEQFGYLGLNLSESVDDCLGPLEAEDKEDQDLIFADGKTPLVVTAGPAVHYPNPPNPSKVLYVNKKEAPVLRVERGVQVTFSIQAGHDVALYITSDPVGGSRNKSEIVYAGGMDAEGVPASPKELTWLPDRKTPDEVYYQSVYAQKMGWKIQVVNGGLSDMYNSSVFLDDQQVTLFWTLSDGLISIAARGEKKSGYLAIGFGSEMLNSFAYVGWVDGDGKGHVKTYWIDGRDASRLHPTSENLTDVTCKLENGIITFEFTRPLSPACSGRIECKNVIDRATPLKVIWAMGARWSDDNLSERNMHSITSTKPVRVMLMHGSAEAEQDLRPVLAVHGFMMFVAWGILIPGGILAARYLKHVKGDGWYQIHVYLQCSGIAIIFLGVLFAAAELRGFYVTSLHVKLGVTAIVLGCAQPINAYFRPKRPSNGEAASAKRVIWEYFHIIVGRSAIFFGIASLVTGMNHLGERYGAENVQGLNWALIFWFLFGLLVVAYLEYSERKRRRTDRNSFRGNWVLGNEEDDSTDLLRPKREGFHQENNPTSRMEVQLEPLS